MIRKEGYKWCVYNHTGTRLLGCHRTKREALAQLRAIEINKKR